MDEREEKRVHDSIGLLGLRAQATAVGLLQLSAELRRAGVLDDYSPVAHGAVLHSPELRALAGNYGVGIPQLCIRYCLQLGLLPLPKTLNPEHLRSNAAVDFIISDADMEKLKNAKGVEYGEASTFPEFGKKREVAGASPATA
jgi:hypothetical protein